MYVMYVMYICSGILPRKKAAIENSRRRKQTLIRIAQKLFEKGKAKNVEVSKLEVVCMHMHLFMYACMYGFIVCMHYCPYMYF